MTTNAAVVTRWVVLPLVLLGVTLSAGAETIYVDDDDPCGSKDGTPACPFDVIQDGIDAALVGDQVLVLPGTYCEWIFMKNGVDVISQDGPSTTTIDAGGAGGLCADRDFAVVRFSNTSATSTLVTRLSGFTITGGKGRPRTPLQRGQAGGARAGGGIFIFNSNNGVVTPIIENNIITGNTLVTADTYNYPVLVGGGIYVTVGRPRIANNIISGNSAADPSGDYGYGGGIYASNYSRPLVQGNTIIGNSATDEGGGVLFKTLTYGNLATLDGNQILGNTAGRLGGGIFAGANADMVVTNNVIRGNHAEVRGGAVHTYYASVDLRNNTIVGNTALRSAGLFLGDSNSEWNLSLHNNVISGNVATYAEFAGGVQLLPSNEAAFSFTYNNLVDNLPSDAGGFDPSLAPGNLSLTPVFLDVLGGDLRLAPGSPGVDQGDDALAPPLDIEGVIRPQDGDADALAVTDMGAYELVLTSGDDDGDGVFNDGDLSGVQGDNPCTGGATTVCDDNCPQLVNPQQEDLDSDGFGDVCDPDDDNDGYLDEDESTRCDPPSDPENALSTPVDTDGDFLCDTLDADDDGDGYLDIDESERCVPGSDPLDPTSVPPDNDGDFNCDSQDPDDDNDGYLDIDETLNCIPTSDPLDAASTPVDTDGDKFCDTIDTDDDNDGVLDVVDSAPLDPLQCEDVDADTCDDCAVVQPPDPGNDGPDADGDGVCDAGEESAPGNQPAVVICGEVAHYAWVRFENGGSNPNIFYRSCTVGGACTTPLKLVGASTAEVSPAVACNGSVVLVLWEDHRNGTGDIAYRRSPDGGAHFDALQFLVQGPNEETQPELVMSGDVAVALWVDTRRGNQDLGFRRSVDGGVSWSTFGFLVRSPFDETDPSLALDGTTALLSWVDRRHGNQDIAYRPSADAGQTWAGLTFLVRAPTLESSPTASVDGTTGTVLVGWMDNRNGVQDLAARRSVNHGASFGGLTFMVRAPTDDVQPTVRVSGDAALLTWVDIRNGNQSISYRRSGDAGQSWGATARLVAAPTDEFEPACDLLGDLGACTWSDARTGMPLPKARQTVDGGVLWQALFDLN